MTRRSLILVLAIVIGLVGAGAVTLYVSKADSRAQANEAQQTVLVANKFIAAGTAVDVAQHDGLLGPREMASKDVPPEAITSTASVAKLSALGDIYPGQPLVRGMFGETTAATGKLTLPADKMAMSVELTDPERVAGFVVPGSEVAIFATLKLTQGGQDMDFTRLLLPKVEVLGIGQESLRTVNNPQSSSSPSPDQQDKVPVTVLTVAVDEEQAQKLAHAAQVGKLYFALLSSTSAVASPAPPVDNAVILTSK